jgi:dephospho-CoA kinase
MLEARTGRQLPQIEKASRADYVIANDGSLQELERQVSALMELLRRRSGTPG